MKVNGGGGGSDGRWYCKHEVKVNDSSNNAREQSWNGVWFHKYSLAVSLKTSNLSC